MTGALPAAVAVFIFGILLAKQFEPAPVPLLGLIGIGLGAALLRKRSGERLVLLLVAFVALGALLYELSMNRVAEDHILHRVDPLRSSVVTGVVCSFPEHRGDRVSLRLDVRTVDGVPSSGIVKLTVHVKEPRRRAQTPVPVPYGAHIEVRSRFRPPGNYRNPGAFDYIAHLARQGVRVVGSVSEDRLRVLGTHQANPFLQVVFESRRLFHSFVDSQLGPSRAPLVKAMVTGDRSAIGERTRERFVQAGAAHLLAISGLHVGFVAWVCYLCLRSCLRRTLPQRLLAASHVWSMPERLASVATLIFIVYYAFLVGARTASVRATIMIGLYLTARIVERGREAMHTLLLAAFLILAWRPASLFEVDFLLSFGAVTAMLCFHRSAQDRRDVFPSSGEAVSPDGVLPSLSAKDPQHPLRKAVQRLGRAAGELAVMTLLATAVTAPISASVFHRVSMVGLLTNLFFVPLTAFGVVPAGLLAYLLRLVWAPLAIPLLHVAGAGAALLHAGVSWSGALRFACIDVPPPAPFITALFYGGLLFLLLGRRLKTSQRLTGIFVLLLLFVGTTASSGKWQADGRLHMGFLDVGQGGATLLVLPDAKTVLIDGGGSYGSATNIGKRVLWPTLLQLGIRRIDVMILTHPHPDHLSGLIGLLTQMPVGEVWDAWESFSSEGYGEFRRRIAERRIPRRLLVPSEQPLRMGAVGFQVLQGGEGRSVASNSEVNNDSLVLRVSFGGISLLVTGDLESQGEQRVLDRWGERLRSTVLQVPHHGAGTSSTGTFLDAVQPEVAVVSVGRHNRFRHPSPEVIGRLRFIRPDTVLRRTDRNGSVWLQTDGRMLQVLSDLF